MFFVQIRRSSEYNRLNITETNVKSVFFKTFSKSHCIFLFRILLGHLRQSWGATIPFSVMETKLTKLLASMAYHDIFVLKTGSAMAGEFSLK